MSADDNWCTCPRCWDNAQRDHAEHVNAVMTLYGNVPVEEFDAKRDALTAPEKGDFETFREDYEFYGAESGEAVASYCGVCTKCGLGCEFKHSKVFYDRTAES